MGDGAEDTAMPARGAPGERGTERPVKTLHSSVKSRQRDTRAINSNAKGTICIYFSKVLTSVVLFPFPGTFPAAQTVNLPLQLPFCVKWSTWSGGKKCDSSPLTDFLFTNLYFQKWIISYNMWFEFSGPFSASLIFCWGEWGGITTHLSWTRSNFDAKGINISLTCNFRELFCMDPRDTF